MISKWGEIDKAPLRRRDQVEMALAIGAVTALQTIFIASVGLLMQDSLATAGAATAMSFIGAGIAGVAVIAVLARRPSLMASMSFTQLQALHSIMKRNPDIGEAISAMREAGQPVRMLQFIDASRMDAIRRQEQACRRRPPPMEGSPTAAGQSAALVRAQTAPASSVAD